MELCFSPNLAQFSWSILSEDWSLEVRRLKKIAKSSITISLEFGTEFEHVTADTLYSEVNVTTRHHVYYKCLGSTGQMSKSQRDITCQHKNRYMSRTNRLTEFRLSENYSRT